MNPVLLTGPLVEPVSLSDVKSHVRIDHVDDDDYLSHLIAAARRYVEEYLGLALIKRTYGWQLSRWPARKSNSPARSLDVPIGPLMGVDNIYLYDEAGNPTIWNNDNYYVAKSLDQIFRKETTSWPQPLRFPEGIEIHYQAGFGENPSDIPSVIRQAITQLVSHFYESRLPVTDAALKPIPFGVTELLSPYRKRRLV